MAATNEQVTQMLTLMQEQITLLRTQQPADQSKKTRRPDRPIVNAGIDDREWALFEDTWSRYKTMINVSSTNDDDAQTIRLELRASCSDEVNRMLFEFVGPTTLNTCTEDDLLAHIKSVAVKEVHHEVHQVNFHAMSQNQGESITSFVARLKSKAFLCKFQTTCACNPATTVSYSDNMVAQRLIAGLCNLEHQRKILSEASTLTTLDLKVKRLQLLETTEESANILHNPSHNIPPAPPSDASAASMYKQQQRRKQVATPNRNNNQQQTTNNQQSEERNCSGCGGSSHPGGKSLSRKNCPAFKAECHTCGIRGHFAAVCRNAQANQTQEDEVLESTASAASVSFSFAATAEQQDFRRGQKQKGKT